MTRLDETAVVITEEILEGKRLMLELMDFVRAELKGKIDPKETKGRDETHFVLLALTRMDTTIETFPMENVVTPLTLESFVGEAPEETRAAIDSPSLRLTREDCHRWNKTSGF